MITKLTLTIEEEVIRSAKSYAQGNGKSLSNLVENYLKSLSEQQTERQSLSPKVQKLMGVVKLPKDFDYKRELGNAISEKYSK